MKKNRKELEIGNQIYKYIWAHGTFSYTVIGKRTYKDSVMYEVECGDCKDHSPCQVLIVQDYPNNRFKFVEMINNYDGYDEDISDQTMWHNGSIDGTEFYYQTKKEACAAYGDYMIKKVKKRLETAEKEFISAQVEFQRISMWIEGVTK